MYEKFPGIPKSDIKRILQYGWKQLYLFNSYGGDVIIKSQNNWTYFGRLTNNSLKHFSYYVNKLATKIRVLTKRKNLPWDGYYYFALSDKQYEEYMKQQKKRGRPRKHYVLKHVFLYKLYDECVLRNKYSKHFFKIDDIYPTRYLIYKREFVTDTPAEEIENLEQCLKFKDLLVTERNYKALWAKKQQPTLLIRG